MSLDDAGAVLHTYAGAFVDGLVAAGIRHVCLCPGSRSTPLALELRRHPQLRVWVHLDERAAGFFALGMAHAGNQAVALLSTSGTAAANFLPAIAEARYARVPLVVLTADRPPELQEVGANQTIDQRRLYGAMVKRSLDLAVPDGALGRYAATVAARAVADALTDPAGPVHLNLPFREPLIPHKVALPTAVAGAPPPAVHHGRRRLPDTEIRVVANALREARRGLIVCGPQRDPALAAAIMRLAQAWDAPVLADSLSQLRCGPHDRGAVIGGYDLFLHAPPIIDRLQPDCVLRFGATPTSKALLEFLGGARCRQIAVVEDERWNDPLLSAGEVYHADARAVCDDLSIALAERHAKSALAVAWQKRWRACEDASQAAVTAHFRGADMLSEPRVFAELPALLPEGATLFVGNSMPVRDLDGFFSGSKRRLTLLANRGVSGIDGVLSTALGVAAAGDGPLALVIGDLSFYHDLNGLLAASRFNLAATIILLNNDGGGIFSFLPQAQEDEYFEELFGTPHGLDFAPAAALFGLPYRRVARPDEFRAAVQESLSGRGSTLIEVRTDRGGNVAIHRELWTAATEAVAARLAALPKE